MKLEAIRRSSGGRQAAAVVLGTLALASPFVASAAEPRRGHSDYLASLTARSLKNGFGRESVPLLAPVAGPGREAVARRLLDQVGGKQPSLGRRLQLGALKPGPSDRRTTSYLGESGYVDVFADGTRLRVRGNIDDPKELEKAGTTRLAKAELETLGQRFVKESLGDFVKLGAGESLSFLGVRYLVNGEGNVEAKTETERVVANIAIFGREVNGLPVVGSGSKVAVWFDNARQPVGFDVDWPVYRPSGREQRVLAPKSQAERVAKTTVPVEGSDAVKVRRFECGYVDLGATRRGGLVQAGCSIAWESRGPDGEVSAHSEFVPAGEQVYKERRWPLASALAAGRIINTASPEFVRYLGGPKQPGEAPSKPAGN